MIKMFIGNEEVVSNHEFTINEEMLSASSTILNNCYPKNWELDKDYVSRFYYPKDYSKFILADGEFQYGDNEYTTLNVSGRQPTFETNVDKELNDINIYGNTEQAIANEIWGKNLIYFGNVGYNNHGVTIIRKSNSSIAINGTATSDIVVNFPFVYSKILDNQNYVFSIRLNHSVNKQLSFALMTNVIGVNISANATFNSASSSSLNNKKATELQITIPNGTEFSSVEIALQLEQANSATAFEPATYTAPMPSPERPGEIVSIGYTNLFNKDVANDLGGEIVTQLYTGLRISATTASSYRWNAWYLSDDLLGKTITIKSNIYASSTNVGAIRLYFFSSSGQPTTSIGSAMTDSGTKTVTIPSEFPSGTVKIGILLYANLNGTGVIGSYVDYTDLQLEIGTQAHDYIEFGKYGIGVEILGKNLFGFGLNAIDATATYRTISNQRLTITGTDNPNEVKFTFGSGSYNRGYFEIDGIDGTLDYVLSYQIKENTTAYTPTYTIDTANSTTDKLVFFISGGNGSTAGNTGQYFILTNIQLEKGTQATEYEAYKSNNQLYKLNEPLRKINDTQDLLYIKDNILYVERKIGKIIFDGSNDENWSYLNNYDNNYLFQALGVTVSLDNYSTDYLCNCSLPNTATYSSGNLGSYIFNQFFRIRVSSNVATTANNFKSWLSLHNIEVNYILPQEYVEEVGKVELPSSYDGTNNVILSTGIVTTTSDIYYYWKNYDVLFAGIVKNSGDISLNPRHPHYCNLQILDYKTFLSESNTLDFVISNKTIAEAIEMVVSSVADYGFQVGTIDISSANDIIGAYSTLNKTAYDVLQYLAEISGSRWRARYVDSSSMTIDFYEPETLPQGQDIEYTKEYWEDNNIVDLTFNYGTRDYRNKQIILSDEVYAGIDYTEVVLSNGYNTSFITQQNVGIVKQVLVNGVKKEVISQKERETGADADFYYTPGKNIIDSEVSYTAGTQVAITYTPLVKGRQIVYNNDEVNRIAEQTDTIGVISRYESRNDIVSSDELERIGETYIEYKGKAEVILTLTTQNKDLYDIGEVVYFNAPIEELQQKYMVKSKKTEYVVIKDVINLFYIYELTSSFNNEKAINYFDNQRNKAQGNIQEGQSITRNIDINSSAIIIWGNATITETTITTIGDNILNSALNSPFIE